MVGSEKEVPRIRNHQGDQQNHQEDVQEWSVLHVNLRDRLTFPDSLTFGSGYPIAQVIAPPA
jgi:hypothetical protein